MYGYKPNFPISRKDLTSKCISFEQRLAVAPFSEFEKETEQSERFVLVAAALSALGGLLFGYDISVISGAILFIGQEFALTDFTVALVVNAVLIGALIGA